mmetsp:Transcript_4037/g.9827  ORF Transcript_4037/g.9827 Transcript_4037/m.9827 type:complete len:316 (-) Transcript_4037:1455-2402(-)
MKMANPETIDMEELRLILKEIQAVEFRIHTAAAIFMLVFVIWSVLLFCMSERVMRRRKSLRKLSLLGKKIFEYVDINGRRKSVEGEMGNGSSSDLGASRARRLSTEAIPGATSSKSFVCERIPSSDKVKAAGGFERTASLDRARPAPSGFERAASSERSNKSSGSRYWAHVIARENNTRSPELTAMPSINRSMGNLKTSRSSESLLNLVQQSHKQLLMSTSQENLFHDLRSDLNAEVPDVKLGLHERMAYSDEELNGPNSDEGSDVSEGDEYLKHAPFQRKPYRKRDKTKILITQGITVSGPSRKLGDVVQLSEI